MWTRSQAVQKDTQVKLLRMIKKTWLRYFQLSWFALSDWSKNWCRDDIISSFIWEPRPARQTGSLSE